MDTLETQATPVGDLALYYRNPRRGNIPVIAESLERLGQYRPIVVNRGTHTGRPLEVLAGNHTLLGARQLGWETIQAVLVDVDEDTAARIVAVDNRSSDLATNDDVVLAELLASLPDLEGTGFTDDDLEALLADVAAAGPGLPGDSGYPGEDDIPEPPADPVAERGDLWELGPHRLLCGDATDAGVLERLLDGVAPDIVYTDPPYGISIVHKNGKIGHPIGMPFGGEVGGGKIVPTTAYMPVTGDDSPDTAATAFKFLHGQFPDARHLWWGGNHYASSAGLPDSPCWLIWDKENGVNDFADGELAWTNHTGAVRMFRHMWNGMLRASERGPRVHPNQKPVALAVWALGVIDPDRSRITVLDTFAGSGSTLLAAHQTDRHAFLTEIEPHYIDVICTRWQKATGILPIRDGAEHDFQEQP